MQSKLSTLIPYLLRYRWQYMGGFVALVLRGLLATALPYLLGRAIDALAEGDHSAAERLVAILLTVAVGKGVAQYAMRWVLITLSRDIEYDLRTDLTAHMVRLDRRFYARYRIGDLMARATNDLAQVRSLLGPGLMYSAEIAVISLSVLTVMALTDWVLTLLIFAPMPLVSVSVGYFGRRTHKQFRAVQERFSAISARVQEHLTGLRMLRAYGQSRQEEMRFERSNDEYFEASLGLVRIWRSFYPLLEFLVGVTGISVLGFGGWRVLQGDITVGTFTMFLYFLAMLTWPMVGMGVVVNITQRGTASLGRLDELLRQRPEIADSSRTRWQVAHLRGLIEWRRVTVRYPGSSAPALDRVSLHVGVSETLALIGPVGSGKSTLASLVPRLLDPVEGQVLVDGIDVRELPLRILRGCIGHVPQETFLFSRTIADNVCLGNQGAEWADVAGAARAAMLDGEIETFPDGLDTMVGERGITLSGGQKQRVAVARALLVNPSIIILDDATSSLDAETEHALLARVRRDMPHRTLLIVTHRVSSARLASRIAVLDKGRVVDVGTHDELIRTDGLYARMHERQRLEEELDRE